MVYDVESQSAMQAIGVTAVSRCTGTDMIIAHQSPKASPIEPASSESPKPGTWLSWIEWPYSCQITSASSASSTPPVP